MAGLDQHLSQDTEIPGRKNRGVTLRQRAECKHVAAFLNLSPIDADLTARYLTSKVVRQLSAQVVNESDNRNKVPPPKCAAEDDRPEASRIMAETYWRSAISIAP